jgi:DNA polymerase V
MSMAMSVKQLYRSKTLTFFVADLSTKLELPFVANGIKAGFPSPAMDFMGEKIDLNRILIKHPQETFYAQVDGDSMKDAGIHHGDIMVIDRSLPNEDGKIYVCFLDGEFTVKRMRIEKKTETVWLVAENEAYEPIKVSADDDFIVWGRVIHIIKDL